MFLNILFYNRSIWLWDITENWYGVTILKWHWTDSLGIIYLFCCFVLFYCFTTIKRSCKPRHEVNLDHHYHFYSVKYLKTDCTRLAELRLYPPCNIREIGMVTPFGDSFFLKAEAQLNILNPVCPPCCRGALQMHSNLEQISFPTSGKKASFFWIHLSSLCSTNVDLATCAILIQGEMTCTWSVHF